MPTTPTAARRKTRTAPSRPLPGPGEGKRGDAGHLGYLLRQAAHAHRLRVEHALAPLPLTPAQFSVMTMLQAYPGHSSADLARLALLTPQTMSLIVGNLERAGLLARRPHRAHGRIRQLALTDAGRRLLARAKSRVYALERDLARGLGADDERVVRRWLVSIAAPPDPAPGSDENP